jgi:uncharacterized phiE125 gp8 family phage protein
MDYTSVRIITPPAVEPVTVAECKLDARVDHPDEDALFATLIAAARQEVEQTARRALITRTLELSLDRFPPARWLPLPYPPLLSLVSIRYYDQTGAEQTIDPAGITPPGITSPGRTSPGITSPGITSPGIIVIADEEPGRIALAPDAAWPRDLHEFARIRIRYTAGYGPTAADVPDYYKFDVRGLVKLAYEHRFGWTPDAERAQSMFLAHAAADRGW